MTKIFVSDSVEKTIEGTAAGITSVLAACSVLLPLLASTGYFFSQVWSLLPLQNFWETMFHTHHALFPKNPLYMSLMCKLFHVIWTRKLMPACVYAALVIFACGSHGQRLVGGIHGTTRQCLYSSCILQPPLPMITSNYAFSGPGV